ncbi:uncharacterized protein LOC135080793 isoform X1 [Ostrinia nubilalis]|uniref:uncharacterized protein LOC135080793 isoform X1 n=1 Tax=Ostrinia nubilalis TaxID=29057 RepID=UPI00308249E2
MFAADAMKKDTERLIAEVGARPAIWQQKHPQYKLKHIVKKSWDEIHALFPNYGLVELKKKWKNLKDAYRKELKKNPQMHTSDPNYTYKSLWKYFQDLDFLKDECKDLIEDDEEPATASDNESHDNFVDNLPLATLTSPPDSPLHQGDRSFKRQLELSSDYQEFERKRRKTMERRSSERNSDNYHFLMSILPEMDRLHSIQKIRLRNKINQALLEEMTLAMYGDPMSCDLTHTKNEQE